MNSDGNKENDFLKFFKKVSHDYVFHMQDLKTSIEGIGTYWKDTDYNDLCSIYEEYSDTIEQISKAFFMFNENFVVESNSSSEVKEV